MNTTKFARTTLFVIGIATSALAMKKFNDLDVNHDGYIDRSEASSDAMLRERWNNVDMDQNKKINFEEFKRFEQTPDEPFPVPQ